MSVRVHLLTYHAELSKDGPLFVVDQQGRTINETTVNTFSKDFHAARNAAELAHQQFHGLRHEPAQHLPQRLDAVFPHG